MQVILKKSLAENAPPLNGDGAPKPAKRKALPAKRKSASWGSMLFAASIVAALLFGWAMRDRLIEAEKGLGYYLGIAGATSMLLLLAYPLRKYVKLLRGAGPVSFWFRTHMALGLIGPTLILYHANFGPGSTNSNVALAAMLIVAGSGIVGRVFYAKIHRGLYGKRAEARELMSEAQALRDRLAIDVGEDLAGKIDALEKAAFESSPGMGRAAIKAFSVVSRARRLRSQLKRRIKKASQRDATRAALSTHLDLCNRYFNRIEQAAELAFYERLFAAWHLLHLPLFILLIITAIIHVIAVHLY